MDTRLPAIAEQLLLIERELRLQGWWQDQPPSAEALASDAPFCVDTLAFEQWLQWIFLPGMKGLLESGQALPGDSGIRAMAEVAYRNEPLRARGLIQLLREFDRLIGSGR